MRSLPWYAFSAILVAMFAISVGYGIVLPALPFLLERVAGSADPAALSRHTGLLTGAYILAIFLFAPMWGKLSDRRGRRPVLLVGLIGFAATALIFATAESLPLLYAGRFLSGLFAAAITPVAYALVGDHAPSKAWRAHRFAMINIAGMAGFFVGPLLGGLVAGSAGKLSVATGDSLLLTPFMAVVALALAAALMVQVLLPAAVRRQASMVVAPRVQADRAVVLRLRAVAFVTALAVGSFEVGLALRGKQILGLDATHIGAMFAECSLVMFIVQALVFSPFIDPARTRWLIAPGLATLAAGLAMVPLAESALAMTVAVALIAASAGILSPVATYWASLGSTETQGADLGRMTAAASLGQAVGSTAGGFLFDVELLPYAGFTVTAVVVAAGLLASLPLPRLLRPVADDQADRQRNQGLQQ